MKGVAVELASHVKVTRAWCAGSIFGVLMLAMLPAWIVLLAVSGVMTFNAWKTSNRCGASLRDTPAVAASFYGASLHGMLPVCCLCSSLSHLASLPICKPPPLFSSVAPCSPLGCLCLHLRHADLTYVNEI